MARTKLFVIIESVPAGILRQDPSGRIFFRYADGYRGTPLSLSLPIANREYGQDVVRPYLFGLLPDSEEQRKAIASKYGGRPNNPVAMLAHIGLDCPGAVQFCHADKRSLAKTLARPGTYEPLSREDIAKRLRELRNHSEDSYCLIGVPDAHAKNYSLHLSPNDMVELAPMYDVASALAYDGMERTGRLAMAIGGENRFGRVGKGAIGRYAGSQDKRLAAALDGSGFSESACLECMARLAQCMPTAMERVFENEDRLPGMDELRSHLLAPVRQNCDRTLALL
jgi:HipA-like protein